MVNPGTIMKLMSAKNQFVNTHPKFASFFKTVVQKGIQEGSVIEITVTGPDGTPVTGNMRVQASDLQLFEELKNLAGNQ